MNGTEGCKYLQNQRLREGVWKQVELKMLILPQEKQDRKEAEQWWKENIKYFEWMNNTDGYEYIQKQKLREGVLEKVENMFVLQSQRPLQ